MKTDYRVTTARPIAGRMRKVGDTVSLTETEFRAEAGWGGLEPATAKKTVAPAKPAGAPDGDPLAAESEKESGEKPGKPARKS